MSDQIELLRDVLLKNIANASQVFIVGHNTPDYDAIGSALGVATIASELDTKAYIVVNDLAQELDSGVAKIIEDTKDDYHFINLEEFQALANKNSLLITVDVNKKYLTSVQEDLDKVGKIMIIDHHQETDQTIVADYKHIDERASSTCEIVAQLLQNLEINSSSTCEIVAQLLQNLEINYSEEMANYLYAGIVLDTKSFQKNTTATTHDTAEKLYARGASYEVVSRWRVANYEEDKKINNLIFGSNIIREIGPSETTEITINNNSIRVYTNILGAPQVSFAINRITPHEIYRRDLLARAADKIVAKYAEVAVVMGYVDEETVGICARSKGNLNVGNLLEVFEEKDYTYFPQETPPKSPVCGGGGGQQIAGGSVTTSNIFALEELLMEKLSEMKVDEENIVSQQEPEDTIVIVGKKEERLVENKGKRKLRIPPKKGKVQ